MFGPFAEIKQEILEIPEVGGNPRRVWSWHNLKDFLGWTGRAFRWVFEEKHILLFAFFQIVAIAAGYYLWVQMLGWIPKEVWESDEKLQNIKLNLAVFGWSFLCVGLVSGPVAVFTGCMGASHFLKRAGLPSGMMSCLRMVLPRAWPLWIFCWMDCWFTVLQILERLPKRGRDGAEDRFIKELLYYSWKLGTVGMLPSLLNGKNLFLAAKESVLLIRDKPYEVMLLRGGYSLFCWIVGVLAYAGTAAFFFTHHHLIETGNWVYWVYVWAGIPILIATAVIQIFLRPIFVLGSCEVYSDYIVTEQMNPKLRTPPPVIFSLMMSFGFLLMLAGTVYLYREPLGLTAILEVRGFKSAQKYQASDSSQTLREDEAVFGSTRDETAPEGQGSSVPQAPAALLAGAARSAPGCKTITRVVGERIEEVCE